MAFTWLDKFSAVAAAIPDRATRAEFCLAVTEYGSNGIEPEFTDWALKAVFEAVREDIDFLNASRENGKKGGRKSKETPLSEKQETPETPLSVNCETPETPLSEFSQFAETQNNTEQDKTEQNKTKEREGARFAPPTPAEVQAFAKDAAISLDAERFVDYFQAQGWRLSNGNRMKDWRAAARNWAKRDAPKGGDRFAKYRD